MEKPSEKIESLGDLEPQTIEQKEGGEAEADSVRGGRKAGKDQHEYLIVTMEDVLISSYSVGTSP